MIRFIRDLRLIPIVLIASVCLLALKAADLWLLRPHATMVDAAPRGVTEVEHPMPDVPHVTAAQHSWAQQMFNFPNSGGAAPVAGGSPPNIIPQIVPARPSGVAAAIIADDIDKGNLDITGSVPTGSGGKDAKKPGHAAGKGGPVGLAINGRLPANATVVDGTLVVANGVSLPHGAERAILERLADRRRQLDVRARELDIREGLIATAEKRVEARLAELKDVEAQIAAASAKKDAVESARFKDLVTMYENMKARDAAKIFDRLELSVLIEVASKINPRQMADILAQMSPDTAERLTVELASRATLVDKNGAGLPKIEGRPMMR